MFIYSAELHAELKEAERKTDHYNDLMDELKKVFRKVNLIFYFHIIIRCLMRTMLTTIQKLLMHWYIF